MDSRTEAFHLRALSRQLLADDQACRLDAVREEAKLSKDLMARIPELVEVCPVAIRRLGAMRA